MVHHRGRLRARTRIRRLPRGAARSRRPHRRHDLRVPAGAGRPGSLPAVRIGLTDLGLDLQSPSSYAESATASGAAERRLSSVLLLALLAFVFLAAANALVMVTARRRAELRLYGRTGATRGQLVRMTVLEAALTGGLAWLIGTVAVVPAILGVGLGMLGPSMPPVDVPGYLALSAGVLVLPLVTVVPTAARLLARDRRHRRAVISEST